MYNVMAYDEPDLKNGYWVHDVGLNVSLSEAKLTLKENEIDDFVITVNQANPLYDNVRAMHTHIDVFDGKNNELIFRGRALKPEKSMETSGQFLQNFTFESIESYLLDSIQRFQEINDATPQVFLQQLIDTHNSQVDDYKQVNVGKVDVDGSNSDNVHRVVEYTNTRDTIKAMLLDKSGGFLNLDLKTKTLNYQKDPGQDHKNDTPIEIGRNLKSSKIAIDPTKVITRLIPLGAQIEDKNTDSGGSEGNDSKTNDSNISKGGPTHAVNGDWKPAIRYAAKCTGLNPPESNIETVAKLIQNESNGSETVVNDWDDNAKAGHPTIGLMQFREDTFKKYAFSGYDDPKVGFNQLLAYYNDSNYLTDVGIGYNGKDGEWRGNASGPSGSRRIDKLVVNVIQSGSGWGWPFPGAGEGSFSSAQLFGPHAGNGRQNNYHDGLDFGSVDHPGSAVKAVHSGVVTHKGYMGGLENYVVIKGPDGWNVVYQEAFRSQSSIKVNVGDKVALGQTIGYRDTGGANEHLHVGTTKKDFMSAEGHAFSDDGTWSDPLPLMKSGKGSSSTGSESETDDKTEKIDIAAGYDMFKKAQNAHLQYQMNGLRSRILTDQKYSDCSSFVSYFVELALHLKTRTLYNTDSLHGFLKTNDYGKIYEGASHSLPDNMQAGDVIIMGREGQSIGAMGHTAVMKDSNTVLECSSGWSGGYPNGADVFEHGSSGNPTLKDWFSIDANFFGSNWYYYVYRFNGAVKTKTSGSGSTSSGPRPRITIAPVNNGQDWIDIPDLQKEFGIINGTVEWDDIKDLGELLKKGQDWIKKQAAATSTWTVSALELPNFNRFKVSDRYMFINPYVATPQLLRVVQKEIDILKPHDSNLTIGEKKMTITKYQIENQRKVLNSIKLLKEGLQDSTARIGLATVQAISNGDQLNELRDSLGSADLPQIAKDVSGIKNQLSSNSIKVDLSKAKLFFQYNHYQDHLGSPDYAMQYIKSIDDNIYSSHHYQDTSKYPSGVEDAVEFVRRDSNGEYLDDMIIWNAPHGSTFGLINENGQTYIYHPVFKADGDKWTTYMAKIMYKANTEFGGMDTSITKYFNRNRSFSSAFDNDSKYFSIKNATGGAVNIIESTDVENSDFTPTYSFNVSDLGVDINNQTVQSSDLKMPYFFVDSGDVNMKDKRMMYCFNVVTRKVVFAKEILFDGAIKPIGTYQEPEAISIHKEADGSFNLWLSFNMGSDANGHTEVVYTVPIE